VFVTLHGSTARRKVPRFCLLSGKARRFRPVSLRFTVLSLSLSLSLSLFDRRDAELANDEQTMSANRRSSEVIKTF